MSETGLAPGADRSVGVAPSAPVTKPGEEQGAPPHSAPTLPGISMPKGGGAIRGIDEKVTVGLATGAASISVPVPTTSARAGFGPELSLTYDSGSGAGPFGLGWALGVGSVTRKTARGLPTYQDDRNSDVFVLSAAEDLVPALVDDDGHWVDELGTDPAGTHTVFRYRPRVESGFARIERWREDASGDVHWRVVSRDNVTRRYGQDAASRIADPADPSRVFSWLLDLAYDDRGNAISYEYKPEDTVGMPAATSTSGRTVTANRYLKRIRYGNTTPLRPTVSETLPAQWRFEVVFDYGEHDPATPTPIESVAWPCRPDGFSTYRSTFEIRTQRLCRRILMFHHFPDDLGADDVLVGSTDLGYSTDTPGDPHLPVTSLLTSVSQSGYIRDPIAGTYARKSIPPLELEYSPVAVHDAVAIADADTLANLPTGGTGPLWHWVDLDGEGISGVLTSDDAAWYYKRNVSAYSPDGSALRPRFEPLTTIARKPSGIAAAASPQLVDLHGDGHLCAVDFTPPVPGYFARDETGGWRPFTAFPATASIDWSSPNVRTLDLDGDGLADVLITEDAAFTWFPWLAADGFGPPTRVATTRDEQAGPALVFDTGDSSIFLADMSGDGLSDLVRIRNGEVCYWPNLGYGRFGGKVVMAGAPWFDRPDVFSGNRIHLADIDGSGTADVLYASGTGLRIWFNQSGNGFTTATALSAYPEIDDVATVTAMDLLGTGTTCLTWSSPAPGAAGRQLRYINLMGGIKPHLLTRTRNNLGAETTLTYSTSTSFYLQDRLAGRPWATRLAFPVHVVTQQEILDRISGTRLVRSYTYHHGFFDGVEREFRGFGRVEQTDAESLPVATGGQSDLPPVRTRSWFHTGAYVGGTDIAAVLAGEFWAGDPDAAPPAGTLFEGERSVEEIREACRALRGRSLRTEIYADDGTPQADIPYSVADQSYRVTGIQPPRGASYGSVHATTAESRTLHYERNPSDPRVSHDLTLEVDAVGSVRKSARVSYRRRVSGTVAEQAVTHVGYIEHDLVNLDSAGAYRLAIPVETRTFELTGLGTPGDTTPVVAADLLAFVAGAAEIPYDVAPDGSAQKRLIGRERVAYRSDDLTTVLPFGGVDPLAIVDRTYALRMTPGLAERVYAAKTPDATGIALGVGGFVDLDGDSSWWTPSSRLFYSPDPDAPDAAFAAGHFYLAQGQVDPFGSVSTVQWADDLLVVATTDAAGNTASAAINYRVLRPFVSTDANANRSGVRYDELGLVVASALMGKALAGADQGDHLDTTTAEAAPGDDPTATFGYDLDGYRTWWQNPARDDAHPVPTSSHGRARVRHRDPGTRWLETYTYTDGLGRVALAKASAEPASVGDPTPRWIGTGKVVYDNKAHPVTAYEPFFDATPDYTAEAALVATGVASITRYDPLGRAIRVDRPDATFTSVAFDPWRQLAYDQNDNLLASGWYAARSDGGLGADQQDAAAKAAVHAGTPLVTDVDALGRAVRTAADGPDGVFTSRLTLDISGHALIVYDATGRAIMTTDYDLGGGILHTSSPDAGERWMLTDVAGRPVRGWDSRGYEMRQTYDAIRRPVDLFVTAPGASEILAESTAYGEGRPDDVANNLRAAVYQHRDGAGVATTIGRDFAGNVSSTSRVMLERADIEADWSASPVVSAETFTASNTYDALGRIVTATAPDGSVSTPVYNERSLLAATTLAPPGGTATAYVDAITYDAKGQRRSISYGNGAVTTYTYDPETFRLVHLVTTRPGASPVQDLSYTYDPVGNITRLTDAAQSTIFFANALVAPVSDYTHDVIYRLRTASGREHIGQSDVPVSRDDSTRKAVPLPTDPQAMRTYTDAYAYDVAGNMTTVTHTATGGGWTRVYTNDDPSDNRLAFSSAGGVTDTYAYDVNGNMTSMPQLNRLDWDFRNRLEASAQQVVNDGTPITTWYRYDAAGQRVRKTTLAGDGSPMRDRFYLGGYEIYREYSGAGEVSLERRTVMVSDAARTIAIVETTTVDSEAPAALPATTIRYQLGNHLDSAAVELDSAAAVISYEEYYPYGATSFQAGRSVAEVSLKRYRFTGKERDEETGLNYHGARYYAPWLGRWTSPDPAGIGDHPNAYCYAHLRPTHLVDPSGRNGERTTVGDAGADLQRDIAAMSESDRQFMQTHAGLRRPHVVSGPNGPSGPDAPDTPSDDGRHASQATPAEATQGSQPAPTAHQEDPPQAAPPPTPGAGAATGQTSPSDHGNDVGAGSWSPAFGYAGSLAFTLGLPDIVHDRVTQELTLSIPQTVDRTGAAGGAFLLGYHRNWTFRRFNFSVFPAIGNTFGPTPPRTDSFNSTAQVTAGGDVLVGGPNRDHPWLTLTGNLVFTYQHFASIGSLLPGSAASAFVFDPLSVTGILNATFSLGGYVQKIPLFTPWIEGFTGAMDPGGRTNSRTFGFNTGFAFNLLRGIGNFEIGPFFNLRGQTATVNGVTSERIGWGVGLGVGFSR